MIYFDNSATSPVHEEVYQAMLPYLLEEYGNPSSKYYFKAEQAKVAVENARVQVAKLINAKSEEIIFTAGATESTNLIIKGYTDFEKYYGNGKNHIITSEVEHKATLNVCKFLNGDVYSNKDIKMRLFGENPKVDRGYKVTFLKVDKSGLVDPEELKKEIKDSTSLISIIYVNNEIGTINDIAQIAKICKEKGVAFHSDATQALGKVKIDVDEIGKGLTNFFMSFSAHKLYGPKGIGAAYLKGDDYGLKPITALLHGGEQENGVRAGTLAVHDIVGFGKAAELALRNQENDINKIEKLDGYTRKRLNEIEFIDVINEEENRLPGILSVIVNKDDFHNERFIKKISEDIAISTGSACSAGEPSHVIKAIGMEEKVNKVLRITLSNNLMKRDVDVLIDTLKRNFD